MDILALLGDNNIVLGTELLSRLYTILEIKLTNNQIVNTDTFNTNPIYGIQLEKVVDEVEVVSKQIYNELSKILSMLCNDQSEDWCNGSSVAPRQADRDRRIGSLSPSARCRAFRALNVQHWPNMV